MKTSYIAKLFSDKKGNVELNATTQCDNTIYNVRKWKKVSTHILKDVSLFRSGLQRNKREEEGEKSRRQVS